MSNDLEVTAQLGMPVVILMVIIILDKMLAVLFKVIEDGTSRWSKGECGLVHLTRVWASFPILFHL